MHGSSLSNAVATDFGRCQAVSDAQGTRMAPVLIVVPLIPLILVPMERRVLVFSP